MSTQESELVRFLGVLDDVGCLRHVVLIGSWAEFLYRQAGMLEGFEPNIKTMAASQTVSRGRSSPGGRAEASLSVDICV